MPRASSSGRAARSRRPRRRGPRSAGAPRPRRTSPARPVPVRARETSPSSRTMMEHSETLPGGFGRNCAVQPARVARSDEYPLKSCRPAADQPRAEERPTRESGEDHAVTSSRPGPRDAGLRVAAPRPHVAPLLGPGRARRHGSPGAPRRGAAPGPRRRLGRAPLAAAADGRDEPVPPRPRGRGRCVVRRTRSGRLAGRTRSPWPATRSCSPASSPRWPSTCAASG